MENRIYPNDIVKHVPSGETWVVAGVDPMGGFLIPKGYPFPSMAKLADCQLMESRYHFEPQDKNVIKYFLDHGMQSFIDCRSAMFHGMM